jgi:glutathione peroxidase
MSSAIYDIPVQTIQGEGTSLAPYRGKVLLVVNVASKCGLTPQYNALQQLYARFKDSGLMVLGFPANDFAGQEPGSNDEIATFCKTSYSVDFPLFSKIAVTGAETHPLYRSLIAEFPGTTGTTREDFRTRLAGFLSKSGATPNQDPEILWNFEKFLVGRDGRVVARFSPEITPEDPMLIEAVEKALSEN